MSWTRDQEYEVSLNEFSNNLITKGSILEIKHTQKQKNNTTIELTYALSYPDKNGKYILKEIVHENVNSMQGLPFLEKIANFSGVGTPVEVGDKIIRRLTWSTGDNFRVQYIAWANRDEEFIGWEMIARQSMDFSYLNKIGRLRYAVSNEDEEFRAIERYIRQKITKGVAL